MKPKTDKSVATHRNDGGQVLFSIRSSDFRETDGFRFPFQVEYLDVNENVIATEQKITTRRQIARYNNVVAGC